MKKAFTLIELLVVIAIIAILAAILFPVFAQAKVAAKKTQDLSNQKQVGTAVQIYLADYDDLFPLTIPSLGPTWFSGSYVDTPADWDGTVSAAYHDARRHVFPNSTNAYMKNWQILKSPTGNDYSIPGWIYSAGQTRHDIGYSFNGNLQSYSSTAVNDVAKLRMMTSAYGNRNYKGATRPAPFLRCPTAGSACVFVPSSPTCSGANGTWSELSNPAGASMWLYGNGMNAVFTDSHAKFQRVASGPTTASDFRSDFWARYNAGGVAQWVEYQDTNFCHTLLFMPDFDFNDFGTPIQY